MTRTALFRPRKHLPIEQRRLQLSGQCLQWQVSAGVCGLVGNSSFHFQCVGCITSLDKAQKTVLWMLNITMSGWLDKQRLHDKANGHMCSLWGLLWDKAPPQAFMEAKNRTFRNYHGYVVTVVRVMSLQLTHIQHITNLYSTYMGSRR